MTIASIDILQQFLNDPRCDVFEDGTVQNITGRIFRGYLKSGYYQVSYKNRSILVSRLVCAKFHGLPDNSRLQVNHIDGNKENNRPNNLEWVSSSDNLKHKHRVLGLPGVVGRAKISLDVADEIRSLHQSGYTPKELCETFHLCKSTISEIINYHIWRRS